MLTRSRLGGPRMNLGIAVHDDEGTTLLALSGELDIASAGELEDQVAKLVAAGRTRVVADLSALSFCDSTGIGTLVRANNDCRRSGGYFRLAALSRNVARVMGVVGLLATFPVYRTVEAARVADPDGLLSTDE